MTANDDIVKEPEVLGVQMVGNSTDLKITNYCGVQANIRQLNVTRLLNIEIKKRLNITQIEVL